MESVQTLSTVSQHLKSKRRATRETAKHQVVNQVRDAGSEPAAFTQTRGLRVRWCKPVCAALLLRRGREVTIPEQRGLHATACHWMQKDNPSAIPQVTSRGVAVGALHKDSARMVGGRGPTLGLALVHCLTHGGYALPVTGCFESVQCLHLTVRIKEASVLAERSGRCAGTQPNENHHAV